MTQPFLLQEQEIIPALAEGFCSSSSLWPPGHGGDVFSWPRRRRDEKRHFWVSDHDSKPLCHLRLLRPRLSSTHLTENAFAAKCHSASTSVCSDSSYKFVIRGCDVQALLLFSLFHHHNCCIIIKRLKSSFVIQGADYFSIQMVEDSLTLCLTRDAELWSLRQLSHHNCPPLGESFHLKMKVQSIFDRNWLRYFNSVFAHWPVDSGRRNINADKFK